MAMQDRTNPDLPTLIDMALVSHQMTIRDLHKRIERFGIEVSYTSVHNWVTGRSAMGVGYAYWVCRALALDPAPFILAAALPISAVSPNTNLSAVPPATG